MNLVDTNPKFINTQTGKDFFSFESDMYLCLTYTPPHSGQATQKAFFQMKNDTSRFSKLGVIFFRPSLFTLRKPSSFGLVKVSAGIIYLDMIVELYKKYKILERLDRHK